MITLFHRRSRLRIPALLGGVLLLFGGAVDAWGASACVYHGHDAVDDPAHALHEAEAAQAHAHLDHDAHGHHHDAHGPEDAHGAPAAITQPPSDHAGHGEDCECRLRCIAVGALPPLEPEVIEVPEVAPPQEDALSPVDLATGVHAPATVPYLLPFSLAPPSAS